MPVTSINTPTGNNTETAGPDVAPEQNAVNLPDLPLIPGEDAAVYQSLAAAIDKALSPDDAMEMLWSRDIAYCQWNAERFRRILADTFAKWHDNPWDKIAATLISEKEAEEDDGPLEWDGQDEGTAEDPDSYTGADQNIGRQMAQIAAIHIQSLERFDRIAMKSEGRRNAAYRALERHRAGMGAKGLPAAEPKSAPTIVTSTEHKRAA